MARTNTKIGDVFSVQIDKENKKYFQLIAFDLTQLNSDVIRVFTHTYANDETPTLKEIIKSDVDFYAHCVTKIGIKLGFWLNIGNDSEPCDLCNILFRDTNDAGSRPGEQVKISSGWYVWKIGDLNFTRVGKLEGENKKAEIGLVITPDSIVHRIKTGKYDFEYPDFE